MGSKGHFIISLDFELYWGIRDNRSLESYKTNLLGVRQAVPALLKLFEEFDVHCTWATVGFLFAENKAELMRSLPEQLPEYTNRNLSPYPHLEQIGNSEADDPFHYAPSLIELINKAPNQEIASHTFSHYYCLERGQTAETFRQDLAAAIRIAEKKGMKLKSLVFPRNQYNKEYVQICQEANIICYRGNESSWIYKERNEEQQKDYKRAVRLLDAYINISGHNTHSLASIRETYPYNIPASRFLRPYMPGLRMLDSVHLHRIKAAMSYAAQHNQVYHLWWHPHNFGTHLNQNLGFLRKILEHYRRLNSSHGMQSITMGALAEELNKPGNEI